MRPLDYHAAEVITRREFEVLELRYTHNMSQRTVALAIGRSRSTVRSIEERALQKINLHERSKAA